MSRSFFSTRQAAIAGANWLVIVAVSVHVARFSSEIRRMAPDKHAPRVERYSTMRFQDEFSYYRNSADGFAREGLAFFRNENYLRSPPAPWLWLSLWGRNIALTRLANIGLVVIGSCLIACIVRGLAGRMAAGAAFLLTACGYQVVYYSATILSEPLAFFFMCSMFWLLFRHGMSSRWWLLALAGAACGVAALSRAAFQFAPIFIIGAAFWHARRSRGRGLGATMSAWGVRESLIFALSFACMVGPWMGINKINHGVARLANGFGAVMYLGMDIRADGDEPVFRGMQFQTENIARPYDHMQTEGDRRLMAAALENLAAHPGVWLASVPVKIGRFLIGGPRWHFFPFNYFKGSLQFEGPRRAWGGLLWWGVAGTLVTVFGIAGLSRAAAAIRPDKNDARAAMVGGRLAACGLAVTGYLAILHGVSYAQPRFAMPIYGVFVLGCVLYVLLWPSKWLTAGLLAVCAATVLWLAVYSEYVPDSLSVEAPSAGFSVDGRSHANRVGAGGGEFRAAFSRVAMPFNATFWVQVKSAPLARGAAGPVLMTVKPEWAEGPPAKAEDGIVMSLRSDGRAWFYRFCVELNGAWRGRVLRGLTFSMTPGDADVELGEVVLGH